MIFYIFLLFLLLQRTVELLLAKRNEKWMKARGAFEIGATHYPYMILLHSSFFVLLVAEVYFLEKQLSELWVFWGIIFILAQCGRIWCLTSLGPYWNTKILILPQTKLVNKGPYQWMKHPNYLIVAIELLVIPLLFNAYMTALLFFILNAWMMSIRIPIEEQALQKVQSSK